MQILIFILNVFILFNYSKSQIIQLYNKYHLYEFQSSQVKFNLIIDHYTYINNIFQKFKSNNYDFLIIGEGIRSRFC